jgi:hypothetical protein
VLSELIEEHVGLEKIFGNSKAAVGCPDTGDAGIDLD